MIGLGFDLSSPSNNNESQVSEQFMTEIGIRGNEDDFRAALDELGIKSASDIVSSWLRKNGKQLRAPVEGVREGQKKTYENTYTTLNKRLKESRDPIKTAIIKILQAAKEVDLYRSGDDETREMVEDTVREIELGVSDVQSVAENILDILGSQGEIDQDWVEDVLQEAAC